MLRPREPLHRGEVEIGHLEPRLQIDEEPRRGLLADARHEAERIGIVGRDGPSEVERRVHRHDRQRERRADTVRAEQRLEARCARRAIVKPYSVCASSRTWSWT